VLVAAGSYGHGKCVHAQSYGDGQSGK
jgi:hypothetical protein